MHLIEDGDDYVIIGDDRHEAARLHACEGSTEVIVAMYAELTQQGGFRGYDFLYGVLMGMTHATIVIATADENL